MQNSSGGVLVALPLPAGNKPDVAEIGTTHGQGVVTIELSPDTGQPFVIHRLRGEVVGMKLVPIGTLDEIGVTAARIAQEQGAVYIPPSCPTWCVAGPHDDLITVEDHYGTVHALADSETSPLVELSAPLCGGPAVVNLVPERDNPYMRSMTVTEARDLALTLLRVVTSTGDDTTAALLLWLLDTDKAA